MSATMPVEVLEVTSKFMRNPVRILVKKEELTLDGIAQYYVQVEKEVSDMVKLDNSNFDSSYYLLNQSTFGIQWMQRNWCIGEFFNSIIS